jgi:2-keto-4-pentenoate hydratase/2-oxohepta-3-ene-1,7-dioic acid hydratase in catechol pathway
MGVLKGDAVVDVTSVCRIFHTGPHDLINGLIGAFLPQTAEKAVADGKGVPLSRCASARRASRQYRLHGVNYMEDGTLEKPAPINAFHKASSAIIGDGDTMVLPDVPATIFEGEAEIAVVIGRPAKNVSAKDAMKYVFGYTNFIDGSARGVVPPTNVFYQMKSRDTFAPIGPYIVTADEIKNVGKMQIRLTNNGTVMQNFNTDDMAHKIPRCIEWVTSIHTLMPGDILATGTNHRGLNPFMNGDKIELECEGLGVLHIKVKDDLKRTWARITRLKHKESGAQGVHTPQIGGKYAPAK